MLQKLNERIQGIVAWVIISLIAATFALFGIDYYFQSRQTSMTAVEVNGTTISKQDVELQYRRIRQMQNPAKMTASLDSQIKQQVLEQLIINKVSVGAAKQHGFQVTPKQANSAIISIPQFQEDGHFSVDRYQQAISGALFTPETFLKQVQQGMLLNQQRFAFIGTAFALPSEVKQFVKLYLQTRDYAYLTISASQFLQKQEVADNEIKTYYQKHPKEFIAPEQVALDYIILSVKNVSQEMKATDEQAKQYYEANQANFLTPAQWTVSHILLSISDKDSEKAQEQVKQKAEKLYEQIKENPGQFAEVAQKYSDDKISAGKGGALPTITAGQSNFDKYLVQLKKQDQVSAPVLTENGYEIFKLTEYKPAKVKPFTQVKSQIKEQLKADAVQGEYARKLEVLSDVVYQVPDSLDEAAKQTGLSIQSTDLFTQQGGQTRLTKKPEVIQAAFSHDVLELGNNSEPMQLDSDQMVVIRVKQHVKATEKPFTSVREQIKRKLVEEKSARQAKSIGEQLMRVSKDNAEFLKLKNQYQLKWKKVTQASRETDSAPTAINELAFSIANPNTFSGKMINENFFAVVKLEQITDGQMEELDEERKDSIEDQLEASYGITDYDLYIGGLLDKANIKREEA